MILKKHSGTVKKGKFLPDDAQAFIRAVRSYENKRITVTIDTPKKTRSSNQSRYYWGCVLAELSEFTGHTPEELHEFFKAKFLRVPGNKGIKFIIRSTTSLTTAEMEKYLEEIRRFASVELSFYIPDPNEFSIMAA